MWRLLMVAGLRRGELCGLRCADLEADQGVLKVRRQIVVEDPGSRIRVKAPKSPNGLRTLVLDEDTLEGLTGGATSGGASRYLFTGRTGRHLRPDNVTGRFNHIAVAAGVRPLGPHQLRHLIASNLLDAGLGIHEVAERLGHDPATLMRYYTASARGRGASWSRSGPRTCVSPPRRRPRISPKRSVKSLPPKTSRFSSNGPRDGLPRCSWLLFRCGADRM
jgi:integrase